MKNETTTTQLPDFDAWISEKWLVSGGLITPATASKILKKTAGRITQMIKEGKLRVYKYGTTPFVSFPDVMKISRQLNYEIVMKELEKMKKDPNVPQEVKDQYLEDIMPTLELLKNSVSTD